MVMFKPRYARRGVQHDGVQAEVCSISHPPHSLPMRMRCAAFLVATCAFLMTGCGGSGTPMAGADRPSVSLGDAPSMPSSALPPPPTGTALPRPDLRFSDTGVSVNDAITRDGRWSVISNGVGWEYSLDLGKNWIRGSGGGFEVQGDGPKTIWVRARDEQGNTSEVVVVGCVLDTMPPASPSLATAPKGMLHELRLDMLEDKALWEYSVDSEKTWFQAEGRSLSVYGNGVQQIALRQVDLAGNPSVPVRSMLPPPGAATPMAGFEASSMPLEPTVLGETGPSVLIHGEVVRGDADFVRIDVPAGFRLHALRLIHYVSDDAIAFYALQRGPIFDAGTDIARMAAHGHLGPKDIGRNLLDDFPGAASGSGPLVLWVQQTGMLPTRYAMQMDLRAAP